MVSILTALMFHSGLSKRLTNKYNPLCFDEYWTLVDSNGKCVIFVWFFINVGRDDGGIGDVEKLLDLKPKSDNWYLLLWVNNTCL